MKKKDDRGNENGETMEESNKELPLNVKIYGAILLILIFISGCIGNILSILAITFDSKLRKKVIHILILTVAICGLLVDLIVIPTLGLHVIEHWPVWPLNKYVCTVVSFVTNTCTSMMALMLLVFSVDRYFVIVRKQMLKKNHVVLAIIILLIIIMCFHGTYLFQAANVENELNKTEEISVCNDIDGELLNDDVRIPILTMTVVHALAAFISVLILIKTSITWWQMKNANLDSPLKSVENDLKGAALITGGYIIFWIPYWILLIFRSHDETTVRIVVISFILSLMATTIAPFSAVMFLKKIRLTIMNIITGCKQSDCCIMNYSDESDTNPLNQTTNTHLVVDAPKIFVKGKFKRGTKRIAMDSVSIGSSEFSREESPGEDNDSYDDLTELQPQRESVF